MAKYLLIADQSDQALGNLMKAGGSSRREAAQRMLASIDGQLESFYFSADGTAYAIVDAPSLGALAATNFIARATGAATTARVIGLLSPEDVDKITQMSPDYQPPPPTRP